MRSKVSLNVFTPTRSEKSSTNDVVTYIANTVFSIGCHPKERCIITFTIAKIRPVQIFDKSTLTVSMKVE